MVICVGRWHGGARIGEIASKIAVEVIIQQFIASKQTVNLALKKSILAANTAIFNRNRLGNESGMGTTIVCAAILLDKLYIAHVGDSRAYLLRKGQLSRLTKDHTLVNELLNNNVITSEEAQNHPQSNVLIRALGKKASVLPEISGPLPLQNNDLLLLCTDGISGYMDDEQISFLLQTNSNDPQIAATAVIQNADSIGGEDNATAIVILMENT